MSLSCVIYILSDANNEKNEEILSYADQRLRKFVETFAIEYKGGKQVFNVPSLIHLTSDVRVMGAYINSVPLNTKISWELLKES